ncbi:MAG: diaminopimelate decarboxylase [Deltaproteobacteria bacterium]|jgi:diaminopimelate decarboxylase|nr:diaminopimelate decarboxylase [Deltaproteobacteria bacterium]
MNADYVQLADKYGCPFYIYEESAIRTQLERLRRALPDFRVLYSVKTNPHAPILRFMALNGVGADAASAGEVERAAAAGMPAEQILYSAPGKGGEQLRRALGRCRVTADSYTELTRLDELAGRFAVAAGVAAMRNDKLPVGLRINPDFSFGAGEFAAAAPGLSSKFGVDEESLAEKKEFFQGLKHIRPAGVHVFLRSQVLNAEALAASFAAVFKIAARCREELGWGLDFINFGGGLGIGSALERAEAGRELDLELLGRLAAELVRQYERRLPGVKLFLESGRFLVGRAGTFVTRIEDIKESRGKIHVIAPGGLSGFLRPAMLNLLAGLPGQTPGPLEPLFSGFDKHRVGLLKTGPGSTGSTGSSGPLKKVTVSGTLCTSLDVLAGEVELPDPQAGDILTVSEAGAYAATLSPFAFASFDRPAELYRAADGRISAE